MENQLLEIHAPLARSARVKEDALKSKSDPLEMVSNGILPLKKAWG